MIDWRRSVVLAIVGAALGYSFARSIDALLLNPLDVLIPGIFSVVGLGFILRKLELTSFFAECGIFAYANYLGIALERSGVHVKPVWTLVLLVGVGYSGIVVGIGILGWAFAQRLDAPKPEERDKRFLEFLESESRRNP